jgi:hypothetical protein
MDAEDLYDFEWSYFRIIANTYLGSESITLVLGRNIGLSFINSQNKFITYKEFSYKCKLK